MAQINYNVVSNEESIVICNCFLSISSFKDLKNFHHIIKLFIVERNNWREGSDQE